MSPSRNDDIIELTDVIEEGDPARMSKTTGGGDLGMDSDLGFDQDLDDLLSGLDDKGGAKTSKTSDSDDPFDLGDLDGLDEFDKATAAAAAAKPALTKLSEDLSADDMDLSDLGLDEDKFELNLPPGPGEAQAQDDDLDLKGLDDLLGDLGGSAASTPTGGLANLGSDMGLDLTLDLGADEAAGPLKDSGDDLGDLDLSDLDQQLAAMDVAPSASSPDDASVDNLLAGLDDLGLGESEEPAAAPAVDPFEAIAASMAAAATAAAPKAPEASEAPKADAVLVSSAPQPASAPATDDALQARLATLEERLASVETASSRFDATLESRLDDLLSENSVFFGRLRDAVTEDLTGSLMTAMDEKLAALREELSSSRSGSEQALRESILAELRDEIARAVPMAAAEIIREEIQALAAELEE